MRIISSLLCILFLTLPLIHGSVFYNFGIEISTQVGGNYEFTKSIFFSLYISLLFLLYCGLLLFGKIPSPKITKIESTILGLGTVSMIISTVFSLSPIQSFIVDSQKGHTLILLLSLTPLYTIGKSLDTEARRQIINAILFGGALTSFIAVKELYAPSLEYGALASRALGSFGHPNYLGGYLLLLIVLSSTLKNSIIQWLAISIFFIGIILAKSLVALALAILFITYKLSQKYSSKIRITLYGCVGGLIILALACIGIYFPEKLHSLISRLYIWQTTLGIIADHPYRLLLGFGPETLQYYFESYKVPELYIFENFGYTADRPHNLLVSILYHFGILGLALFAGGIYQIWKNTQSTTNMRELILVFLLFGGLQYYSIASLALLVFLLSSVQFSGNMISQRITLASIALLLCSSLVFIPLAARFYLAEIAFANYDIERAQNLINTPKYQRILGNYAASARLEGILSPLNIKSQTRNRKDVVENCEILVTQYPSAENYILCGNALRESGRSILTAQYYEKGLEKLPDLWNEDSTYWEQYFVHKTITGNRFFSKKFGDIGGIREYLEKN